MFSLFTNEIHLMNGTVSEFEVEHWYEFYNILDSSAFKLNTQHFSIDNELYDISTITWIHNKLSNMSDEGKNVQKKIF